MRWTFVLIAVTSVATPLVAQTSLPRIDDNVVVTATVEEEEAEHLPASVAVIDAEEIAARQATEIAELLSSVAGLSVARSGSAGQVTSLFTRGTESDHTLVLWNGIELNNPYFGGFNWAFLPTEGVERVEVVRGPFSALYGSDALGGVVQVISGAGRGVDLRIEGGDDGYYRTSVSGGVELGSARVDVLGHVRRGDGELQNDFYDSDELAARVEWTLDSGATLGVVTRFNESDTGIPFSLGATSPERRIAWREWEVAVPYRTELGAWSLGAMASLVSYDSAFRDPEDAFGFTSADTESSAERLRFTASRDVGDSQWVSLGVEGERVSVDDRSVFGPNLENAEQTTWALFGQSQVELGPVRIDLGLRYDDNDAFGDHWSPKVGLTAPVHPGGRLRASYGEGFRAPSVGELFFPFSGNPELEPERTKSYEVGYSLERGRWSLDVTAFENRLTDLIDFDFLSFTNVNVGRARTRGVELGSGLAASKFDARWSATWLETEDESTGLDLLRRAEWTGSFVVDWRPMEVWGLTGTLRYVGERPDVDPLTFARRTNDDFLLFDLAIRWQASRRLSPYARIENLFDESYEEVLGFPAPDRGVVLGLAIGS